MIYSEDKEDKSEKDKERKSRNVCFDCVSESGYHPSSCERDDDY